jgi:hypothetical protein
MALSLQLEELHVGKKDQRRESGFHRSVALMSCRIERLSRGEGPVVLRVSGRIEAEHFGAIKEMIGREIGGTVLDLEEVLLVDRDALGLLATVEKNGIELRNCPAYVREWIVRENANTREQPNRPPCPGKT